MLAVSIGADIVDMTGENRVLAFYGLRIINQSPRIGLKVIIEKIRKTRELSISDVVFGIAPRINAAGRIEHGRKAVELLIETDINKYIDSLQEKYSSIIQINFDLLDNINLTHIDLYAYKIGVPYPYVVPSFPILTSNCVDHKPGVNQQE